MKRLGNFEIHAVGSKKSVGTEKPTVLTSVVSRHHHYSQAHQYLVGLGAEKSGLASNAIFTKGNLRYHIVPVFPKEQKKKSVKQKAKIPMKENSKHVKTILEVARRARGRILEDAEKTEPDTKNDKDKDIVVKGNKTLTGEKADKINVNPEFQMNTHPKGMKAIVGR